MTRRVSSLNTPLGSTFVIRSGDFMSLNESVSPIKYAGCLSAAVMNKVQSEDRMSSIGKPWSRAKLVRTIPEEAWMKLQLYSRLAVRGGEIRPGGNGWG